MKMHPVSLILASLTLGIASGSSAQEQPAPPPPPEVPAPPPAPDVPPPPPPPPAQAVYPPCSRTLQDQCTNTRPESDTKGGPPAHSVRHRPH